MLPPGASWSEGSPFAVPKIFPFSAVNVRRCSASGTIRYGGGAGSLLLNIVWILISGLPLAIESALFGCLLCVTIVGIPFGLQHFKIAKLALMPFGSEVV